MRRFSTAFAAMTAAAAILIAPVAARAATELTMWSHWAAEKSKRAFVEDAVKRFEAKNPGVTVKVTWYEKPALYAALKTALRANQAPDIFYAEPDQIEYMENGLLLDLSGLNWANIEPWAKQAWTWKDKPYGFPLEASTVELYYNTKTLSDLGIKVSSDLQLDAAAFADLVKKAAAKNITPMSEGVGDRPFPGAYLTQEALLKRLGTTDYDNLLNGKLHWNDPRVVETLKWVKSLIDAGLLPKTFTSLKLGESHTYFYSNPGAATFLMESWYTSRAFNPPNQGGQPDGFPLGIMKYPKVPNAACAECKTLRVGGSYVVNANTKHPKESLAFLNSMATPEMGNEWLSKVLVQTGIKADPSKMEGGHAAYFKMLADVNKGAKYYFGLPLQVLHGKPREVFTQVVNNAFPAGNLSVDEVVKRMSAAY
jgi:multiple sugar transport system substrate-binding protein